jgi:hypothetical protein
LPICLKITAATYVVADGIGLAGLLPRYTNIRRGAIITFVAAWVVQPWQLREPSCDLRPGAELFSLFLAPVIGMMASDDFLILHRGEFSRLTSTKLTTQPTGSGMGPTGRLYTRCSVVGHQRSVSSLAHRLCLKDLDPSKVLQKVHLIAFLQGQSAIFWCDPKLLSGFTNSPILHRRLLYQRHYLLFLSASFRLQNRGYSRRSACIVPSLLRKPLIWESYH